MEPSRDQLDPVAQLMERWLALPESEQRAALEQLCADHPEHAKALRARVAWLAGVGAVAEGPPALPERLGDFRVLARLGGGGMGVVVRAIQESIGREVALKLVRPELLWFEGARERFRREIEAVGRLSHPGIVAVFAAGEEQGVPYFAMELVDGGSLAETIAKLSARAPESLAAADLLPAPRAARNYVDAAIDVARQVAEALDHAHAAGLVHRDVKPSNVMLTADGRARLVDFGLTSSQAADRITRSGSQVGTLHYMAPEQIRGASVDARADVYSLGALLYELLTLRPPFEGEDRVALERAILEGRPDPIRPRNRRVSADVETVCLQAMAPEPARRYATARAFADDLQRLLDGRPVAARPPGRAELLLRWSRHHRGAAAAIALALLLAAGVPTTLWLVQRSHSKEVEQLLTNESKALGREREARAGEQQALSKEKEARAAEQLALADMQTSYELVTSVFRDSSPIYTEGKEVTLREAIDRLEERTRGVAGSPRAHAQVLSLLGQLRLLRAQHAPARALLDQADALLRDAGHANGRERAVILQGLARLDHADGNEESARARFEEAIALARADDPGDVNFVAQTLAFQSDTWSRGPTVERAAAMLEEALATFRPRPGRVEDVEWHVQQRAAHAQQLGVLSRLDEARAELEKARADLGEWSKAPLRLRLVVRNAEATIARFANDLERSNEALLEVIDLSRSTFGPSHPMIAQMLIKRAEVLLLLDQRDEAEPLLAEACDLVERAYGKESQQATRMRANVDTVRAKSAK